MFEQQPQRVHREQQPHDERGLALLAVLFALTLLMLLALPFAVSMSAGADAAMRDVEQTSTEQSSASVRDLMVAEVALSHPAIDPTPLYDGLEEYPRGVDVPESFKGLEDGGRVLLGGEVEDLQRYLSLDAATPLLLANVIGAVGRLQEDLVPEAGSIPVGNASGFPETGYVWINNEVIRYEERDGNSLIGLERGLFRSQGFADGTEPIAANALVIDYRCVLASVWPFLGRGDGSRRQRQPWRDPREMLEIQDAGLGTFTADEIDAFARVFAAEAQAETCSTWGRPERVFNDLTGGISRTMTVKSAIHLGAGSTVRLRDLRTGAVEYGMVMSASSQAATQQLLLPSVFQLHLLMPVTQTFTAVDTVVEPLAPPPVNINTASEEVLTAVFSQVRRSANLRVPDANQRRPSSPPFISPRLAQDLANEIAVSRSADVGGQGPYTGWQNLVGRLFAPRLAGESNNTGRNMWVVLYRALQSGRDSVLEMGTSPICFRSGPWVSYRAAASRSRSLVAAGVVGRHERSGLAAALPGFRLERRWDTQVDFEEAFELDRRSPFWVTSPINLGHIQPGQLGNDPAARYFPHLVPVAYPGLGLGAPRYPVDDKADAGIEPGVAMAAPGAWPRIPGFRAFDHFAQALHRRGRDVSQEGPYLMRNTGPQARGGNNQANTGGRRHDQLSFPFSANAGFMGRYGVQFWLEPQTLAGRVLFDHNDGDPERNRMVLMGQDGELTLEILDEAGLDPNPGDSPAGVQRTASQIKVPLAEIALPADTPIHINMSAPSGRAADLSLFVDGMERGKRNYVTYLTAELPVFDPNLANNQPQPGQAPGSQTGNERYLSIQVESTDNFPPVGVLRIGLELFEYSSINGNAFEAKFVDSLGGRGARQIGREHRPDIPLDANGEPTVDINDPQFNNVNLDVFPEHPVGSMVELYGYAALVSPDTVMMTDETTLADSVGGFAVARGFINNPEAISISPPTGQSIQIGVGISETWSGELELADPVPTGTDQPPAAGQEAIINAFAQSGGYALLMQERIGFEANIPGQLGGAPTEVGGVELIRYASRNGNKLTGVQRAQMIAGQDNQIENSVYDGTARNFIQDWTDWPLADQPDATWDDVPGMILWVIPISLPVQNTGVLWDPSTTGLTEWMQILPAGDVNDTEWVRYDAIADNRHVCRINRAAWRRVYRELTQANPGRRNVQVGPLGPNNSQGVTAPPWGTVLPTTGYIGYVPQIESTYPQIARARAQLRFRGDPFTRTTSHPQNSSRVMQCQRLQLIWNNFGAYTGRVGRHDRVALVQGSAASGSDRPNVEWHTVTWKAARYGSDNLQNNNNPDELLGPWPFQLVAFKTGVQGLFSGLPQGTQIQDPRAYDRIVKFPSGELPAAYCENPTIGAGAGGEQPMQGIVDEVGVVQLASADLVLDEILTDSAATFTVNRYFTNVSTGAFWQGGTDLSAAYPEGGGLVQIDDEILAYSSRAAGVFTIAQNARGLLNTQPRAHDRGARVKFLTNRPAAILTGGVGASESVISVQDLGALPRAGTVLMGQELLHYTWQRRQTRQLEMPRWYPPGEERSERASRGLFRGRFGTRAQGASSGEVVIEWPFRYWDRYADHSDDPELAYFQMTSNEAPVFYRTLRWREETRDPRVDLVCRVRTDSLAAWSDDPASRPDMWEFTGGSETAAAHRIDRQASRIEIRFQTIYRPGAVDLQAFTAHGWKTAARVEDVRVEYEGRARIFGEQVTAR